MFKINFNSISAQRRGLSLIEIMIAMVMTLIVLGAMMAAFSYGSTEMAKGRAAIELNNRLITAEEQLRRDLDRITVDVKPHQFLPFLPKGYVEIVDGPETDYDSDNESTFVFPAGGTTYGQDFSHGGNELVFGDRDDYFACTIKSDGKPFRGRLGNEIVESHFAEVVWFSTPNPATVDTTDHMICRRQLLILPTESLAGYTAGDAFFAQNDISAREVLVAPGVTALVANSLTDLAIRGNRFCHIAQAADNPASSSLNTDLLPSRFNEDHIICTSVAAFDIQVFSPDSSVYVLADGTIAESSDFCSSSPRGTLGTLTPLSGAYIDLGKGTGLLGGAMLASANCNYGVDFAMTENAVYDTGTSQYNRNEANDSGSNGVVDPGGVAGVADDPGEGDSIAPFNTPVRGIKFSMRVIEPNTKQVRQLTVKKSFVAQ
jgi:type II secretory pathway pseudopilin PulG